MAARRGHFALESGDHGDLWLELDRLFFRTRAVRPFVAALAERLRRHQVEAVCGPLTGGAFVAQMVADHLSLEFLYAERLVRGEALQVVEYRLPSAVRGLLRGRTIAVVDDAISAGSAVRATLAELETCGAQPVVIGALMVLGASASAFFANRNLPLESLAFVPANLWSPATCPLCAPGVPLETPAP